jgi:type I restriction enzyme S subunit
MPIILPDRKTQDRIVDILSSLDDKIALNKRINDNLEQQAQALYRSWFVDFEPFKSGNFVDSELGKIPEGWRVSSLRCIATITKKTISPNNFPSNIFEHYSIPAYDTDMMPNYELGKTILSNKYSIDANCILISKLNPRIKRIWLPICQTESSICSTEFVAFKPIIDGTLPYLYCLISSPSFYGFILSLTNGSTGSHQRFQPESSLDYIFVESDSDTKENFCRLIAPILSEEHKNQKEIQKLSAIRDSILPKLMSGELKTGDLHS